jgi:hypothetical protein
VGRSRDALVPFQLVSPSMISSSASDTWVSRINGLFTTSWNGTRRR